MAKNANNKVSIWQSLHNAWKVQDIRKKLIYTFFMLILPAGRRDPRSRR